MSASVFCPRASRALQAGLVAALAMAAWPASARALQDVIRTTQPPASETPSPGLAEDAPPLRLEPLPPRPVVQPSVASGPSVLPTQRVYLGEDASVASLLPPDPPWTWDVVIPAFSVMPVEHLISPQSPVRVDLASQGLCRGYFDPTPALTLEVEAGTRLTITTQGDVDTVLLVRLPDGYWACDDDGGTELNARLDLHLSTLDGPVSIYAGYYENLLFRPSVSVLIDPAAGP
jgi:hypothetical protein